MTPQQEHLVPANKEEIMLKINVRRAFTFLEVIMIILLLGILAVIVIPAFINFRSNAEDARAQGTIGSIRSAALAYYSKTALPQFQSLCTAAGNPYRHTNVANPCYPASYQEVETLLSNTPNWGDNGTGGSCYDASTGQVTACQ